MSIEVNFGCLHIVINQQSITIFLPFYTFCTVYSLKSDDSNFSSILDVPLLDPNLIFAFCSTSSPSSFPFVFCSLYFSYFFFSILFSLNYYQSLISFYFFSSFLASLFTYLPASRMCWTAAWHASPSSPRCCTVLIYRAGRTPPRCQ